MSLWNQMYFPDPNSVTAQVLFRYHDTTMIVVTMVLVLVGGFMILFLSGKSLINESMNLQVKDNNLLEMGWTISPAVSLGCLGFISVKNLYNMEVGEGVGVVVKVIGHQWYWEYRYEVNFNNIENKEEFTECLWDWLLKSPIGHLPLEEKTVRVVLSNLSECKSVNTGELIENYLEMQKHLNDFYLSFCGGKSEQITSFKEDIDYETKLNIFEGQEKMSDVWDSVFTVSSFCSVLSKISSLFLSGDWYYKYDSYIVPESMLKNSAGSESSGFRLQDVNIPCYLIRGEKNEVIITTADVFHSWGVSELGVKGDAVPGRANSVKIVPLRSGLSFGFCYELCGTGHSQMPIMVFVNSGKNILYIVKSGILMTEAVSDLFNEFIKNS